LPFLPRIQLDSCGIDETLWRSKPEFGLKRDGTWFAVSIDMAIIDTDPHFPHGEITGAIKDALFETHRELGYGFSDMCVAARSRSFCVPQAFRSSKKCSWV